MVALWWLYGGFELPRRKPSVKLTPPNTRITYKRATLKWPSHSTWRKSLSGSPFEKAIADHDPFFARGLTIGLLPFENRNRDSGPFFEKRIERSRSVFRKRDLKADFHFRMGATLLLPRVRKTDRDPRSLFRKVDRNIDFQFSNGRPKNSTKEPRRQRSAIAIGSRLLLRRFRTPQKASKGHLVALDWFWAISAVKKLQNHHVFFGGSFSRFWGRVR